MRRARAGKMSVLKKEDDQEGRWSVPRDWKLEAPTMDADVGDEEH